MSTKLFGSYQLLIKQISAVYYIIFVWGIN